MSASHNSLIPNGSFAAGATRRLLTLAIVSMIALVPGGCPTDSSIDPNALIDFGNGGGSNVLVSGGDSGEFGAANIDAFTPVDTPIDLTLLAQNADGARVQFAMVSYPNDGELGEIRPLDDSTAAIMYTPPTGFIGVAQFSYSVADMNASAESGGQSNSLGTVRIAIQREVRFAVEPLEGVRDLNVRAYAYTVDGGPLPDGSYAWQWDGKQQAGPLETHADMQHVFRSGGLHTVRLSLTLVGVPFAINLACSNNDGRLTREAEVVVWPLVSGHVVDAAGNTLAGALVRASGLDSFATSDASGYYELSVPMAWSGDATATLSGYDFSPVAWSLDGVTSDVKGADFTGSVSASGQPNTPPVSSAEGVTLNEDGRVTVSLHAEDAEADALTYQVLTLPQHGTLTDLDNGHLIAAGELPYPLQGAGARLRYSPAHDFNGDDGFSYSSSDRVTESASARVSLHVRPVNDAPTVSGPASVIGAVNATSTLTVSLSAGPANESSQTVTLAASSSDQSILPDGNIVVSGSQLSLTPIAGGGPITITVAATDDGGNANGGANAGVPFSFGFTVFSGPVITGQLTPVATVGAQRLMGEVDLQFTGSGAWSGSDFLATTNVDGTYAQVVPDGWTGSVSAADPVVLLLTPESLTFGTPVSNPLTGQDLTAWHPPIGIPAPSFGIKETHYMYAGQRYDFDGDGVLEAGEEYPDAGNGPYTHYVDNTNPSATDSGNPFGTPGLPRATLPRLIEAGSVVEVHGGPYTYVNGGDKILVEALGSAAAPVFVRGVSATRPIFRDDHIMPQGSYLVLENLALYRSNLDIRPLVRSVSFLCIRNTDMYGDRVAGAGGGARVESADSADVVHDITFFNNNIYDNGDPSRATDDGPGQFNGIEVTKHSERVWALDNHIHHNSEDALQIGNNAAFATKFIYIGRNRMYSDRENAVDIKQAQDVIVSQNDGSDYFPSPSSGGETFVTHRGARRIWFLNNDARDCRYAFVFTSNSDQVYVIGNVMTDTTAPAVTFWQSGAITVESNLFYNTNGVIDGTTSTSLLFQNNIVSHRSLPDSRHIEIAYSEFAANSTFSHNLYYEVDGPGHLHIVWGGGAALTSIAAFQSATGQGIGSIEGQDPIFNDVASGDFSISDPLSPARDAGISSGSPVLFEDTYRSEFSDLNSSGNLSIRRDFFNRKRQAAASPDIGPYEIRQ